jgi:hypothetical protein
MPGFVLAELLHKVKDDPNWLHHTWGDQGLFGLFLSTPTARLLALKYPSVLTISTDTWHGLPYIHIAAQQGFDTSGPVTAALAFVPALTGEWYARVMRTLVARVLFDASRTHVVVTTSDALAGAVGDVFPAAAHHLCEASVIDGLRRGPKRGLEYAQVAEFISAWKEDVLHAPTVEALRHGVAAFPAR